MKHSIENTIKDYIKGSLSETETLELEWQMKRDPFLADAIEGYSAHPELLNRPKSGISTSLTKWAISFTIAFVFVVLPHYSTFYETENKKDQWKYLLADNSEIESTSLEPITKAEIPELVLRPVKPELNSQLSTLKLASTIKSSRIDMVHIPALGVELDQNMALPYKRVPKFRFKTAYLHNLKVVVVDTTVGQSNRFTHHHVPAAYESKSNFQRSQKGYIPRETTIHYMDKPLEYFSQANYSACLKSLNTVSKRLPNNLNVSFYRALCLYNLGDYSAALKHFRKTQSHLEQGFSEESTWYQALCLDKLNRDEEALALYQRILDQNGFYAFRAASMMALKSKAE